MFWFGGHGLNHAKQGMLMRLVGILTCIAIVYSLYVMMQPHSIAIAEGRFKLSITSDANLQLPSDLLVAYCWSQDEMMQAKAGESQREGIVFRRANQNADGVVTMEIPHISKRETGQEDSYNEPKFIVVQFQSAGEIKRESLPIPEGRGDRTIRVRLDQEAPLNPDGMSGAG